MVYWITNQETHSVRRSESLGCSARHQCREEGRSTAGVGRRINLTREFGGARPERWILGARVITDNPSEERQFAEDADA